MQALAKNQIDASDLNGQCRRLCSSVKPPSSSPTRMPPTVAAPPPCPPSGVVDGNRVISLAELARACGHLLPAPPNLPVLASAAAACLFLRLVAAFVLLYPPIVEIFKDDPCFFILSGSKTRPAEGPRRRCSDRKSVV